MITYNITAPTNVNGLISIIGENLGNTGSPYYNFVQVQIQGLGTCSLQGSGYASESLLMCQPPMGTGGNYRIIVYQLPYNIYNASPMSIGIFIGMFMLTPIEFYLIICFVY